MIKYIIQGVGSALTLVLVVLIIEALVFYFLVTERVAVEKTELIAVFAGSDERIQKGYELVFSGISTVICISPRTEEQCKDDIDKFGALDDLKVIIEARSNSTFQNALRVGEIIRKKKIQSVALVTNITHMPRAYILFKINLIGSETAIISCPVENKAMPKNPFSWTNRQKKQVYNEMIELWGSIYELLHYEINGESPEKSMKDSKMVGFLRSLFLFE